MTDPRAAFLIERAPALGATLDAGTAARLVAHLELLLKRNEELNLTGVRDMDEALTRHVLDSLAFGLHMKAEATPPVLVVDLGSGGGFPGAPVAAAFPSCRVTLLDSTRKKAAASLELARAAGIPVVDAIWGRAEDLIRDRHPLFGAADALLARAVGPLAAILDRAGGLVRKGGAVVAWKSAALADDERADGARAARRSGFEEMPDVEYETDRRSRLVRYRRTR